MSKLLINYAGTAQHLYWLLTGEKHPKVEETGEQNNVATQTQTPAADVDSLPDV